MGFMVVAGLRRDLETAEILGANVGHGRSWLENLLRENFFKAGCNWSSRVILF